MKKLTELCSNCLGCNFLEDENFEGVTECEYATNEQMKLEDKADTCKYYRKANDSCLILTELLCTYKDCKFYKKRKDI